MIEQYIAVYKNELVLLENIKRGLNDFINIKKQKVIDEFHEIKNELIEIDYVNSELTNLMNKCELDEKERVEDYDKVYLNMLNSIDKYIYYDTDMIKSITEQPNEMIEFVKNDEQKYKEIMLKHANSTKLIIQSFAQMFKLTEEQFLTELFS